jgi:hypothetical protein
LVIERLRGEGRHRIDYRHVIWSLVKKPWGFARYRYREALFPTQLWRQAYEALVAGFAEGQADLEYLRVLHLAAATRQPEVESALQQLLGDGKLPTYVAVRALAAQPKPEIPELTPFEPDLGAYDGLLAEEVQR